MPYVSVVQANLRAARLHFLLKRVLAGERFVSTARFIFSFPTSSYRFLFLRSPPYFLPQQSRLMEGKDMSYHHHYKPRDFDFAQRLVTLRRRAGLSQEGMALQVGVTTRAIRNWEGGTNYPSEANLEKLVELYLDKMVFTSEHEQDEAHVLWDQLREVIPRRIGPFDGQWFARLLKERQEQPAASEAQLARLPPLPQRANQGTPPSHSFSRLSRGDWSEAPDVSAFYGRTDELSELERWLLADHCRLVAVLRMR